MCTFPSVYTLDNSQRFRREPNLPPTRKTSLYCVYSVSKMSFLILWLSAPVRWDLKACVIGRYLWHICERYLSIVCSWSLFIYSVQASFDFSPVGIRMHCQWIIASQFNVCLLVTKEFVIYLLVIVRVILGLICWLFKEWTHVKSLHSSASYAIRERQKLNSTNSNWRQ